MDQEGSRDSILETVEKELRRRFGGSHPPEAIRQAASTSVDELLGQDVRVKAFVPVLAGGEPGNASGADDPAVRPGSGPSQAFSPRSGSPARAP